MKNILIFNPKLNVRVPLALGTALLIVSVATGCGGGGGGSSSPTPNPTPSGTPGGFDGTYTPVYTPADAVAADGKAPTGTLRVVGGRGTGQTTFYLQTSVVSAVQTAIDNGLRNAGFAGDIPNNQVPSNIRFDYVKDLDSNGKVVFTSSKNVSVCGVAQLTLDSTIPPTGNGQATYTITFPPRLTLRIRGTNQQLPPERGNCNNLPNRIGTVVFER
ncbi:MAG TPA: hypothetical protein VGB45_03465 [Abditibacterium sp.]|jgi:hypothetical protein